jgi:hypothetical protein
MAENATSVASRGTLSISFPAPGILFGRVSGHYSQAMLKEYLGGLDEAVKAGHKLTTFHDWEEMTGYDSVCRQAMTDWVLKHVSQIHMNHILVRSKIVAMGVATANLLTGGKLLFPYTTRVPFERALKTAVAEAPRRTL